MRMNLRRGTARQGFGIDPEFSQLRARRGEIALTFRNAIRGRPDHPRIIQQREGTLVSRDGFISR
jgi:hypothetical protein